MTPILSRDELYERRDKARTDATRLRQQRNELLTRARADDNLQDPGIVEKVRRLTTGIERAEADAEEAARAILNDHLAKGDYTAEDAVPAERARHGERVEDEFGETTVMPNARQAREGALRCIERHVNEGALTSEAADRVDSVLRGPDAPLGLDARYIETHGSPAYERAFAKLLRFGDGAVLRMTQQEQMAVQAANHAEELRTAMAEGTGSTGGFGIPIAIDPTINLASNGSINPIRGLANVRTMSTRELRLVASDGVVAQYQAEAAVAVDNSPTLVQPVITAQRCTSYVPFSWEVGDDWGSLVNELVQLVADAKDVVEATKFLLGTGTNEPVGVLAIGSTGSLTTTQRVLSAGAGAVVIGDVYALKQALGQTRFAQTATWAFNPTRLDAVFRLTPSGSTTEPQIMTDRNGPLLGRPTAEWSTMATAVTTGSKWAIYGDFKRGYTIGDRIGMSASLIPHLFDQETARPTGQKGLFCYWRNSAVVVAPNALRYGETS
jgi:HK97 family phage major capsid protein